MSAAGRVLVLARAEVRKRFGRERALVVGAGTGVSIGLFGLALAMGGEVPAMSATAVAALGFCCAFATDGTALGLAGLSKPVDRDHLPVRTSERRVAWLLAEDLRGVLGGMGVAACWLALLVPFGLRVSISVTAPSGLGPAASVAVLAVTFASFAAPVVFVASAPFVLGGRRPLRQGDRVDPWTWGLPFLVVAVAGVAYRPLAALAASAVSPGARELVATGTRTADLIRPGRGRLRGLGRCRRPRGAGPVVVDGRSVCVGVPRSP